MTTLLAIALLQNAAVAPVAKTDGWWKDRHAACVETTKNGEFDVAFVGDSITQGWEGAGKAAWEASFSPLKSANFGFSGDRTQHALWRLANGEIVGADPKVVVVMIGTNNLGSNTPAETADGVVAVVDKLLASTRAKVLLLGIFPRAFEADDKFRSAAIQATSLFWERCDKPRVTRLDIGKHFVRSDGRIRSLIMPDALHLNAAGYEIWARAILPTVRRMLAD